MKHLKENNISYIKHLKFAFYIGFSMIISGFGCIIHGLFPFLFEKTASSKIKQLYNIFKDKN